MDRAVGHSLQLSVCVRAPLWYVGAGWAAVGGALASGVFARDPVLPLHQPLEGLLTLALVWLLADPLLGTVWEMGAGRNAVRTSRQLAPTSDTGQPLHWLPYTQPGSPAWRLAEHLSSLRMVLRVRPDGLEMWSSNAPATALPLTLIVAAVLGYVAVVLVVVSTLLSWLGTQLAGGAWTREPRNLPGTAAIRAAGIFGIPWLIGCAAGGGLAWPTALLGLCLTVTCVGVLQEPLRFRLIGGGQLAMISLLVGLRHPLAAAVAASALVAQWGLATASGSHIPDRLRAAVQPFILGSLLVAALAVSS